MWRHLILLHIPLEISHYGKATKKNKKEKKSICNGRIIQIEHGSITLLIFSTVNSTKREANIFYSKIAEKIDKKETKNEN